MLKVRQGRGKKSATHGPLLEIRKGGLVARKRPIASDVRPLPLICLDGGKPDAEPPPLTRAEASALRRSAWLTHAQLSKHLKGAGQPPLRAV